MVFVSTFDDPHSGRDLAHRTNPFMVTISDLYIAHQSVTKINPYGEFRHKSSPAYLGSLKELLDC